MNQLERLREELAKVCDELQATMDLIQAKTKSLAFAEAAAAIRSHDLTPYAVQDGEVAEIVAALRWDMRYTVGHVPVTLENAAALIERQSAELREARKDVVLADAFIATSKGRCYCCGWTLATDSESGCTPANCSYRPSEHHDSHAEWHRKATALAAALTGGK